MQGFGEETLEKELLGRPRLRWEYNITMDLKSWNGAWTGLSWLFVEKGGGHLRTR